jgi:peptidase E
MIAGTGGSFPPQSSEIDNFILSKYDKSIKIGIITAATTRSTQTFYDFLANKFLEYGIKNVVYIDLYSSEWIQKISSVDLIYISGGNTFKLLDIMDRSGFLNYVSENKRKHSFAGFSAGATILGADVSSSNDVNEIGITKTQGLNLIDALINPHYKEDGRTLRLQELADRFNLKVICLSENQGFFKNKDSEELVLIGNPLVIHPINKK